MTSAASDRTRRTAALVLALGLALLLGLVAVVGSGPVDYVSAPTITVSTKPAPAPTAVAPPAPPTQPIVIAQQSEGSPAPSWLTTLAQVVGALVVGVAAYLALVLARRMIRRRWARRPRARRPAEGDADPLPGMAGQLADAVAATQAQLESASSPRNAVVECWIHLQEAVAATGLAAGPAQTPTEYLTRVLDTWAVDPGSLADLADLYREARFSDHVIGAGQVSRARAALQRIHAELTRAAAAHVDPSPRPVGVGP
ncbi:MAG: DUF4129 domain-containing protein [Dermatophilaceae bacterium]